jgi:hypothetical protein
MKERRMAKKKKHAIYMRMSAGAVAEAATVGDRKDDVKATGMKECYERKDGDDEVREEYEGTEAQARLHVEDREARESLPRPSTTGPRRPHSLFSPVPSQLTGVSTPGRPSALQSELRLALELGSGLPIPSPTISCVSSGSDTSAPTTPMTPTGFSVIGSVTCDEAAPFQSPISVRPRPHPRPRTQFRTFSASITARSPLSLSFPLSLSLPLVSRRTSTPNAAMQRCVDEDDEDGRDNDGHVRRGTTTGEDPFGMHGGAYYAPGARAALGIGDAYDLSAWAWASNTSPHRHSKKKRHIRPDKQSGDDQRVAAATSNGGVVGSEGSGPVYRVPVHAASAPQLSYAARADKELEYLRAIANATAKPRVVQYPLPAPATVIVHDRTPGYRRGMRPLLLPQKLGLLGSSRHRHEMGSVDSFVSGDRTTGWELDLERGVCGDEGDAEA